ncbi:uncharacterized protein LOC131927552 [Physella acuta]|uniref:uncharacterized protein LOC131927552 n=1 Tax=Physella acuta TaxID=109671 RepID=UPI0027DE475A|nr:uncharacterized protein LOC131927552 [Physella acuta]
MFENGLSGMATSNQNDYFRGKHEVCVLSSCKTESYETFHSRCKKNPGHTNFIPINDFVIDNLPVYYQDNDLFEVIKTIADLTVMLSVRYTSQNRPEFFPNTTIPYPFYDVRGKTMLKFGTGMVSKVLKCDGKSKTCPRHQGDSVRSCESWWEIEVETAAHVVFDKDEAQCTTCTVDFNCRDSPLVTLDAIDVTNSDVQHDSCRMKCVTHDMKLGEKLLKKLQKFKTLRRKVSNRFYLNDRENLAIIVSHPHGCHKHVSIGRWITKEHTESHRSRYVYDTPTCTGSSGAHVYIPSKTVFWFSHIHNGHQEGRGNYCSPGWL